MSTKDPYEGLSEESIAILKAQTTSEPVNVNYRTLLLRYATPLDKAEILVSYVFSP
jgi:ATP-binding cassette subfamily B (MDR/TAP) protein 1